MGGESFLSSSMYQRIVPIIDTVVGAVATEVVSSLHAKGTYDIFG